MSTTEQKALKGITDAIFDGQKVLTTKQIADAVNNQVGDGLIEEALAEDNGGVGYLSPSVIATLQAAQKLLEWIEEHGSGQVTLPNGNSSQTTIRELKTILAALA